MKEARKRSQETYEKEETSKEKDFKSRRPENNKSFYDENFRNTN